MPPNVSSTISHLQDDQDEAHLASAKELQAKLEIEAKELSDFEYWHESKRWYQFGDEIKWSNLVAFTILHILFIYNIFTFPFLTHKMTSAWGFLFLSIGGFGVTAGVHRFWTHRCYKANLPFRIILMCCYLTSGQNKISAWVRDHRVHHKFSETDADPHNANRGFFFSHVGWLMLKKNPLVIKKGQEINMRDVLDDPVVAFADKYFMPLKLMLCFIIPVLIPVYVWNEDFYYAISMIWFLRYPSSLNFTWSVNSAAHIWGNKPYDKNIGPAENVLVSIVAIGEGWHNYHHVFPWDYKASELGSHPNFTTVIIDLFAKIGWVYDRKKPSPELVRKVALNRGDGSYPNHKEIPAPQTKFD